MYQKIQQGIGLKMHWAVEIYMPFWTKKGGRCLGFQRERQFTGT